MMIVTQEPNTNCSQWRDYIRSQQKMSRRKKSKNTPHRKLKIEKEIVSFRLQETQNFYIETDGIHFITRKNYCKL